jgi:hypothetical protein
VTHSVQSSMTLEYLVCRGAGEDRGTAVQVFNMIWFCSGTSMGAWEHGAGRGGGSYSCCWSCISAEKIFPLEAISELNVELRRLIAGVGCPGDADLDIDYENLWMNAE